MRRTGSADAPKGSGRDERNENPIPSRASSGNPAMSTMRSPTDTSARTTQGGT